MANKTYKIILMEVLVVRFTYNCTGNSTLSDSNPMDSSMDVHMVVLSLLALLLNAYSFLIFQRQRRKSIMRTTIILLSISETQFHFFLVVNYIFSFYLPVDLTAKTSIRYFYTIPPLSAVTMLTLNLFVCARNWCNVLISLSRAEVVIFPMRRHKYFRSKVIYNIYWVILAIGVFLVIGRHSDYYMLVCSSFTTGIRTIQFNLLLNENHVRALNMLYFLFQTGLPWVLVFTSSTAMMISLTRMKLGLTTVSTNIYNARRRNQRTAIKTVLNLAAVFSVCELPNLIVSSLPVIHNVSISPAVIKILFKIGNTMIILDSIFNFFVFSVNLPFFRKRILEIVKCQFMNNDNIGGIRNNTWHSYSIRTPENVPLMGRITT